MKLFTFQNLQNIPFIVFFPFRKPFCWIFPLRKKVKQTDKVSREWNKIFHLRLVSMLLNCLFVCISKINIWIFKMVSTLTWEDLFPSFLLNQKFFGLKFWNFWTCAYHMKIIPVPLQGITLFKRSCIHII